ncbi:hypothetical protein FRC11_012438, partial [Ceratobasidium sp. 423]
AAGKIQIGDEYTDDGGPLPLDVPQATESAAVPAEPHNSPSMEDPDTMAHDPKTYDDDFAIPNAMVESWQDSVNQLADLASLTWADCNPDEIKRRHQAVPRILRDVLSLLSRSTGCEVFAIGVTASPQEHGVFRCATTRSVQYLETTECAQARNDFLKFTSDSMGPVVYPDAAQDNHPLCPEFTSSIEENRRNLLDYFSSQLQWQGGGIDVPYDLIEEDGEGGAYKIVRQDVMPAGLPIMRHPGKMMSDELHAWITHLRAGDNREIPSSRRFQYREPKPGVVCEAPVLSRPPNMEVNYGPPAWAYMWFMNQFEFFKPSPHDDKLPYVANGALPYISVSQTTLAEVSQELGSVEGEPALTLLKALLEHDKYFPAHADLALDRIERWRNSPEEAASDVNMEIDDGSLTPSHPELGEDDDTTIHPTPIKRRLSRHGTSPEKKRSTWRKVIVSDDGESDSALSQSPALAMGQLEISSTIEEGQATSSEAGPSKQKESGHQAGAPRPALKQKRH